MSTMKLPDGHSVEVNDPEDLAVAWLLWADRERAKQPISIEVTTRYGDRKVTFDNLDDLITSFRDLMNGASVRAKFEVQSITEYAHARGKEVKAVPVWGSEEGSENRAFWTASPSGSLTLFISNPDAFPFFKAGKAYYIDFTEVPGE